MESWLRLANLQLAPRAANALLEHFGSPEAIFAATDDSLLNTASATGKQIVRIADPSYLPTSAQLDYIERSGVQVIPRTDERYPRKLLEISDPPPVIFARGEIDEKDRFAVA